MFNNFRALHRCQSCPKRRGNKKEMSDGRFPDVSNLRGTTGQTRRAYREPARVDSSPYRDIGRVTLNANIGEIDISTVGIRALTRVPLGVGGICETGTIGTGENLPCLGKTNPRTSSRA